MGNGREFGSEQPARRQRPQSDKGFANQRRLLALGDAIDKNNGVSGKSKTYHPHSVRRRVIISAISVVVVIAAVVGGAYLYANWRFDQINRIRVGYEAKPISGQPFNILMIGSDSRAGLSGILAKETGATVTPGQRSDVLKIVHVDPNAGTISMISVPRDTVVTLLANQSLYGRFNRINVNFGNGPSLLVHTITANFGIPIQQTIVVSFAGLINAADALGGVYLDFPYPSRDPYSDLNIPNAGCQLIKGLQALAVTRSRHMYYNVKGSRYWPRNATGTALANDPAIDQEVYNDGWDYDGSSDFGRIDRQNAFLRAMVDRAKKLYNPLTINSFLSQLPQGVTLDNNFSLNELIGLAVRFHSINANAIRTYTLPTVAATNSTLGDVLFVDQPSAQQLFAQIFGSELKAPTNPPPNTALQTPQPPTVATTVPKKIPTTSTTTKHAKATTTTTNPTLAQPSFDPKPCSPT
ncbi:MAG TPA: LCP family protein [Acidimicrobiales bacterium]